MSIDELGRASGRRTTQSLASSTDGVGALRDLDRMRRRRTNVSVGAVASVVVVALGIWWSAAGLPFHRATPATPRPTPTTTAARHFKSAPPLCGAYSLASTFGLDRYAPAECSSGPGEYLSLLGEHVVFRPFSFTLPDGWTAEAIPARNGDLVTPYGGVLLRSVRTGAALGLTTYPVPYGDPADQLVADLGPAQVARLAAENPALDARPLVDPTVLSQSAPGYDLSLRPDATLTEGCLVVGACAPVFRAWGARPYLAVFGVAAGRPSRMMAFGEGAGAPYYLLWMWGAPGTASVDDDVELSDVFHSLTLFPQGVEMRDPNHPPA